MPSEAEFLAQQAARAKARLRSTTSTLADEVLSPFQIAPFIRGHPWWSVSGAAVVGFLSARAFRGRDRASGSQRAGGSRIHAHLASVSRRIRRVLSSTLSTIVVANLRGDSHAASASASDNGTPTAAQEPEPSASTVE